MQKTNPIEKHNLPKNALYIERSVLSTLEWLLTNLWTPQINYVLLLPLPFKISLYVYMFILLITKKLNQEQTQCTTSLFSPR